MILIKGCSSINVIIFPDSWKLFTCVKVFLIYNNKKGAFGPNSKRHRDNKARQTFISAAIQQSYRVSFAMQALSNESHTTQHSGVLVFTGLRKFLSTMKLVMKALNLLMQTAMDN